MSTSAVRPGPHFELGRRRVELLLDNGRAGVENGSVNLVPMRLSERGSIGPAAG